MRSSIPRKTRERGPQEDYSDIPLPKMKVRRGSPKKGQTVDIKGLDEISSITKATQELRKHLDLDLENHTGEEAALRFEDKLLLIIDTNFAISHLSILKDLAKLHERYGHILVVPWAVIRELDGLKNSGKIEYRNRPGAITTGDCGLDQTLGQRARLANTWIFEQLGDRSQSLFGQKVSERLSESKGGDDAILDCCRYFQHKADSFVVILSDDKNLCMKALIHEIMTVSYTEGMTAETIARITHEEYSKQTGEMMDMDYDMDTRPVVQPEQHTPVVQPPKRTVVPPKPIPKRENVTTYIEVDDTKRKREPKPAASTSPTGRQMKSRKVSPGGLVSRHASNPALTSPPDLKVRTPTPQRSTDAPVRRVAPLPSRSRASTPKPTPTPTPKPTKTETPEQAARKFEHIDDPKIDNPEKLLPEVEKVVFKVLRMAVAYQAPNHNIHRATSIGSISDIMERLRATELKKFTFPNLRNVRPGSKAPIPERLAFLRGLLQLSAEMEKPFTGEYPKNYQEAVGWAFGIVNSSQ